MASLTPVAIAGERREVLDQRRHIIGEMRAQLMTRDERLLPWREAAVGLPQDAIHPALQARDFFQDIDAAAIAQVTQFVNFAFDLGNRFFEIQIAAHYVANFAFYIIVIRHESTSFCAAAPCWCRFAASG